MGEGGLYHLHARSRGLLVVQKYSSEYHNHLKQGTRSGSIIRKLYTDSLHASNADLEISIIHIFKYKSWGFRNRVSNSIKQLNNVGSSNSVLSVRMITKANTGPQKQTQEHKKQTQEHRNRHIRFKRENSKNIHMQTRKQRLTHTDFEEF